MDRAPTSFRNGRWKWAIADALVDDHPRPDLEVAVPGRLMRVAAVAMLLESLLVRLTRYRTVGPSPRAEA